MSQDAGRTGFAIEIRERYGDVIRDRWPVSVSPLPDELLSSWLHRLALANGIAPRLFAGVLGLGEGMWSPRLDLRIPHHVATFLCHQTGLEIEDISAMATSGNALTPLLLPLRENAHPTRSTWLQYCPLCLAGDEAPYFRREWRLASRISCYAHRCGLRDRCPACRSGVASFDQGELVPQHLCARCGFDLCAAPRVTVTSAARRVERAIQDLHRIEAAKGSATSCDLVERLLRVPVVANNSGAKRLTGLSTPARIRVFDQLAARSPDWLANDKAAPVTHLRQSILLAGGHVQLISQFTDFLEMHRRRPHSRNSGTPKADLYDLLTAYARVQVGRGYRGRRGKADGGVGEARI